MLSKKRKLIGKKIYLYLVKKEKINWKNKSIFFLSKKKKKIRKTNLSLPCQKREN
jgi:hypothetical protein